MKNSIQTRTDFMELLTQIQKQRFLEFFGVEFTFEKPKGKFTTVHPFNMPEWRFSPWSCRYKIIAETGDLFCELDHRMTNNTVKAWDKNGNPLSYEMCEKHFKRHG